MYQEKNTCLNRHDYAYADLNKIPPYGMIRMPEAKGAFSHKVTRMPDFKPEDYYEKQILIPMLRKNLERMKQKKELII